MGTMRIIGGSARSRKIITPEGMETRPTLDRIRENLFNILQHRVYGKAVLDLFAGSGALSLEALSRGAESAVLVDMSREANRCERENISTLHFEEKTQVLLMPWQQAVRQLQNKGNRFGLVFLDPPYAMTDMREVMESLRPLLTEDAVIVLEHKADTMPLTAQYYEMFDHRKYGYVGMAFFRPVGEETGV